MLEMFFSLNEGNGKGHHHCPPWDAMLEADGRGLARWKGHQQSEKSMCKDCVPWGRQKGSWFWG